MFLSVALLSPPYSTLTYSLPPWLPADLWRPGLRVAVPLGGGAVRAGVALALVEPGAADLPAGTKVRPVVWPLEAAPLLSDEYLDTVRDLAARQLSTPGHILGAVLPRGLRVTARIRVREFRAGGTPRL